MSDFIMANEPAIRILDFSVLGVLTVAEILATGAPKPSGAKYAGPVISPS